MCIDTVCGVHFVGVGPRSGDQWSDKVKALFCEQVVDKTFIVYVHPRLDGVRASSSSEDCCTVLLVQESDKTFIHVHLDLLKCRNVCRLKMPAVC